MQVNATRLFVLGALARGGPMHGHRIRRAAQVDRTELWADVTPGALYGILRRMAEEGLVEVARTEQQGRRPERTVYAITEAGRIELGEQLAAALGYARLRPDPIDLALLYVDGLDEDDLRNRVTDRRQAISDELASWQRLRNEADPYLGPAERVGFCHTLLRLETELAWHDELLRALPTFFSR